MTRPIWLAAIAVTGCATCPPPAPSAAPRLPSYGRCVVALTDGAGGEYAFAEMLAVQGQTDESQLTVASATCTFRAERRDVRAFALEIACNDGGTREAVSTELTYEAEHVSASVRCGPNEGIDVRSVIVD